MIIPFSMRRLFTLAIRDGNRLRAHHGNATATSQATEQTPEKPPFIKSQDRGQGETCTVKSAFVSHPLPPMTTHRPHYFSTARDFFLIITLCFILACFLICLMRPALALWFSIARNNAELDE